MTAMCKERHRFRVQKPEEQKQQCRFGSSGFRAAGAAQVWLRLTMLIDPTTAKPMPKNFWTDPDSNWRQTANIAVKTGMVGCMQVATKTPDREMPKMYINWLKNRQTPRAPTCRRSLCFGRVPADTEGTNVQDAPRNS